MGRFESPCQIVSLFASAAIVSLCIIYVLNIEAKNRYGNNKEEIIIITKLSGDNPKSNGSPIGSESLTESEKEPEIDRKEESQDSPKHHSLFSRLKHALKQKILAILGDDDEYDEPNTHNMASPTSRKLMSFDNSPNNNNNPSLEETLLSESVNHRKIRHLSNKIKSLGKENDLVKGIVDEYCPNLPEPELETTTLVNNRTVIHHDLPGPIMSQIHDQRRTLGRDTDDSDVEPIIACHSYGQLLVTVSITTAVNFGFILLILGCRLLSHYLSNRSLDHREDNYTRFDHFEYPIVTSGVMK